MKKKHVKELQSIASQLPETSYEATRSKVILGAELIKEGVKTLSDGTIVDPEERYTYTYQDQFPVNHFKRIKRIFIKHGAEQVHRYVEKQIELAKEAAKPMQVGGLMTENY